MRYSHCRYMRMRSATARISRARSPARTPRRPWRTPTGLRPCSVCRCMQCTPPAARARGRAFTSRRWARMRRNPAGPRRLACLITPRTAPLIAASDCGLGLAPLIAASDCASDCGLGLRLGLQPLRASRTASLRASLLADWHVGRHGGAPQWRSASGRGPVLLRR